MLLPERARRSVQGRASALHDENKPRRHRVHVPRGFPCAEILQYRFNAAQWIFVRRVNSARLAPLSWASADQFLINCPLPRAQDGYFSHSMIHLGRWSALFFNSPPSGLTSLRCIRGYVGGSAGHVAEEYRKFCCAGKISISRYMSLCLRAQTDGFPSSAGILQVRLSWKFARSAKYGI